MRKSTKSKGHICFIEDYEWYAVNGELYRAHVTCVLDVDSKARIGRWECSVEQARRYPQVYSFLPKTFFA
jgi:hypothetical protein